MGRMPVRRPGSTATCGPVTLGRHVVYTGTPLTFDAYIALHRPMSKEELRRLRREQGRRVAALGFFVPDILHPATAFTGGPRLVGHVQL